MWASQVAQAVKNLPAMQETGSDCWVRKIPWRREWQLTPIFLPEKFHGQRSLADYSSWGCKELDMTKLLTHTHTHTHTHIMFSSDLLFLKFSRFCDAVSEFSILISS